MYRISIGPLTRFVQVHLNLDDGSLNPSTRLWLYDQSGHEIGDFALESTHVTLGLRPLTIGADSDLFVGVSTDVTDVNAPAAPYTLRVEGLSDQNERLEPESAGGAKV